MLNRFLSVSPAVLSAGLTICVAVAQLGGDDSEFLERGAFPEGRRLFKQETFGGNGRTCLTCHSSVSGTVSPEDARERFQENNRDPLFLHDGSDDGAGHGVSRMLQDATILVKIDLPRNVTLADDPTATSVTLRRGIPTTLNTPALDPVLMWDGREPNLVSQARNAIHNHAQSEFASDAEMERIAEFEKTPGFFSSPRLRRFARGGPPLQLPEGYTELEKRGRRFFLETPVPGDPKAGVCAACHGGPMLNETTRLAPPPIRPGLRFQTIGISELNSAGNPVREFVFRNPDGTQTVIKSPDPGRALITGESQNEHLDNVNAFKIPTLWGIRHTAPYFHDNSAKSLEDVAAHYKKFFEIVTANAPTPLMLNDQDQKEIVAYMKLLD